jgi:hypothetical protein
MVNSDEIKFLEEVQRNNDLLITKEQDIIDNYSNLNDQRIFYLKSNRSEIITNSNGNINSINSDIIEFSRSMPIGNKVSYGRLWVELKYYNEFGESIKKENWLNDKYNLYSKWIKRNLRISKCKDFYIGDEAYGFFQSGEMLMMATPIIKVEF